MWDHGQNLFPHKNQNAELDLISILSMMGMLPVLIFKR